MKIANHIIMKLQENIVSASVTTNKENINNTLLTKPPQSTLPPDSPTFHSELEVKINNRRGLGRKRVVSRSQPVFITSNESANLQAARAPFIPHKTAQDGHVTKCSNQVHYIKRSPVMPSKYFIRTTENKHGKQSEIVPVLDYFRSPRKYSLRCSTPKAKPDTLISGTLATGNNELISSEDKKLLDNLVEDHFTEKSIDERLKASGIVRQDSELYKSCKNKMEAEKENFDEVFSKDIGDSVSISRTVSVAGTEKSDAYDGDISNDSDLPRPVSFSSVPEYEVIDVIDIKEVTSQEEIAESKIVSSYLEEVDIIDVNSEVEVVEEREDCGVSDDETVIVENDGSIKEPQVNQKLLGDYVILHTDSCSKSPNCNTNNQECVCR